MLQILNFTFFLCYVFLISYHLYVKNAFFFKFRLHVILIRLKIDQLYQYGRNANLTQLDRLSSGRVSSGYEQLVLEVSLLITLPKV